MPENLKELWSKRARTYGRRCVLNLAIPDSKFDEMTNFQKRELLPLFKAECPKDHGITILDYGCGPGRFVGALSQLHIENKVIGYDPCSELIDMAPMYPEVSYILDGVDLVLETIKIDAIWISLVLGGLDAYHLSKIIEPITKAIRRSHGFIFFAEHISEFSEGNDFWRFRTERFYKSLFAPLMTKKVGSYFTFGDEVGIFVARPLGLASDL